MSGTDAEIVLRYYVQIGQMLQFVRREQAEMELNYNTIRGTGLDGMPKGSGTGDVVGRTATKLAEDGVAEQIQALGIRQMVLCQDAEDVAQALQTMNGVYSSTLILHYRDRHKWRDVAQKMHFSESHVLRLRRRALEMLGEQLEAVPMAEELLARARDARA